MALRSPLLKPGPDRTHRPIPTRKGPFQYVNTVCRRAREAIFLRIRHDTQEILPEVQPAEGIYVLERADTDADVCGQYRALAVLWPGYMSRKIRMLGTD